MTEGKFRTAYYEHCTRLEITPVSVLRRNYTQRYDYCENDDAAATITTPHILVDTDGDDPPTILEMRCWRVTVGDVTCLLSALEPLGSLQTLRLADVVFDDADTFSSFVVSLLPLQITYDRCSDANCYP